MTLVDLKRAVDALSIEERVELAEYIRQSFSEEDAAEQDEITRRLQAHLKDQGHSDDALRTIRDWYTGKRR